MAPKKKNDDFDPNDYQQGLVPATPAGSLAGFDPSSFVTSTDELMADLASGEATLEQVIILNPGMGIKGMLLGKGGDILCNDPQGGTEKRPVGTWRIQSEKNPNVVAVILDCAQLQSRLPPLVGKRVHVSRMPSVRAGSRVVNQYAVCELITLITR